MLLFFNSTEVLLEMCLKILSYNIHKGFDWSNKNYFLQEMKELIISSKAEIVFLQEVVGKNIKYKEKGMIDSQFEYLADELWPHCSYAQNAIYEHGHHGNVIISKYPIENFDISTNAWEKRGILICKIRIPKEQTLTQTNDKSLYAACLHLNLFHSGRKLQYTRIQELMHMKCKKVQQELINSVNRGVKVYLLVDSIGSRNLLPIEEKRFNDFGINFCRFNGIQWKWLYRMGRRLHHKILLIDEREGFVGGINVISPLQTSTYTPSLDFAVYIEGPSTQVLARYCKVIFKKL